ncbi:glycosyltransferase family 4 protein [Mesorhizobium sp. YC-39]|uniref:glycosyltransferase family 4 protein n=1 Tax=unclassified Mesorhizobium TaxID=325217 RepID=UPI0021E7BCC0|nr:MULTISPECIES: glycosyltransferase family 1 protein [unclassified Mesorhizobium]MCV3208621.1 glycosyltransferase family 4 protein [Mesorhizobium sp. YC-2]MCV3232030.1 glycosyltransferase family 4 protein [Mesorhizobium sp. YC-39]
MTRHWTINGRFLAQPTTGVQRYAREIVSALDALIVGQARLARDVAVELLVPPGSHDTLSLAAIRVRTVGSFGGHAWEQAVLPAYIRGGLLSLCNTGPLAVRQQILCIHDVNTRACPQSYTLPFRLLYRTLVPALGRTARKVATVSQYSAVELARYGVCPTAKVEVVSNGHEHALRWTPRHSEQTLAVAGPRTIVVLGSSIPHKNVGLIIGMHERLATAGLQVVVVGASTSRVFGSIGNKKTPNVIWLGRRSDAELGALLSDCLCLAFPSLVEGFGLPPLEAMTLGCPVVMSDRASLPEIGGDAVLYASPCDENAWFDCFMRLVHEEGLRTKLIARGRARTARFQWAASAERYLELMASVDGFPEMPPPLREVDS